MTLQINYFNYLPDDAVNIRIKVFVQEQGFKEEFDSVDNTAGHLVAYSDGVAVATCRFFEQDGGYLMGRLAVLKEYRGKRIGAMLLKRAEEEIKDLNGKKVILHAQGQAIPFYLKQGYLPTGREDEEEGCSHAWIEKEL